MSLLISPNQIQVTDGATTVFDLGRSTPHIIQSVSGTLSIPNATIYNLLGANFIVHLWGFGASATAHLVKCDPNRAFILCYYRISSLPTSSRYGQFNMFNSGSQWIGANGGLLLRIWSSSAGGNGVNGFQGTQFVYTYIDPSPDPNYPDYHRLYIGSRMVCGGVSNENDTLDCLSSGSGGTRDPNNQFLFSKSVSEASGQIDYRIFVGTF